MRFQGAVMDVARQFFVLTKKNLIIRRRHFVITILEIALAILLGLGFLTVSAPSKYPSSQDTNKTRYFPPHNMDNATVHDLDSRSSMYQCEDTCFIAYTPMSPENDKFMKSVLQKVLADANHTKKLNLELMGYESDQDIVDHYMKMKSDDNHNKTVIAVILNEISDKLFNYTIRESDNVHTSPSDYYIPSPTNPFAQYPRFLYFQYRLDKTYMEHISTAAQKAKMKNIEVYVESFPFPKLSLTSGQSTYDTLIIALFAVIGLLTSATVFVLRVVQDKASGMRELLRTMGLNNFVNYCAWFLHGYLVLFIINIIYVLLLSTSVGMSAPFLESSNKFLVWIFFNLYSISLILFMLLISVFFKNGVYAVLFTLLVHLATLFVPAFTADSLTNPYVFQSVNLSAKLGVCLFPNSALYFGLKVLTLLLVNGNNLQWDTMSQAVDLDGTFSMNDVFIMMIVSWFVYIVLIWYWDAVWPWQTGVPKVFYFCLTKSYWRGTKVNDSMELKEIQNDIAENHEEVLPGQKVGIEIKNLTKNFRTGLKVKTAVDKASLKLFEGQITALLGHNGAGKTTTISVITGMFSPSNGTVIVNGYDVLNDLNLARKSMGYCPQSNIFVAELSISQHLEFIATLKGCPKKMIGEEIEKILSLFNLSEKKDTVVSTLSGGMKRKLSLGMALIGGTKVLLLDEPTAGLDTEARRGVWDILKSVSKDRTILLTTHYMEEADALGDRIAIMTDGSIFCSGSSFFLKNKFGTGYHLRMMTKDGCDIDNLMRVINKLVQAKIERNSGRELSVAITSETTENFPKLLETFEQSKESLGIESFGMSVTNMEDVFLKVGEISSKHSVATGVKGNVVQRSTSMELDALTSQNMASNLLLLQFYALVCKRFNVHKRQLFNFVLQVVLPIVCTALLVVVINLFNASVKPKDPPLNLDLHDIYKVSRSLVHDNDSVAFAIYDKLLKKDGVTIDKTTSIQEEMVDIGLSNAGHYQHNYAVGADFNVTAGHTRQMIAYSNMFATHGPGISLNLIDNVKCQLVHLDASIETSVHPFPPLNVVDYSLFMSLIVFTFLSFTMGFLTSAILLFVTNERISKSKFLQLMTRLHPLNFWFAHFAWDFCCGMLISTILFAIITLGTDLHAYTALNGGAYMAFLLYNFSAIPMVYLISFLFKKPASGFTMHVALLIVLGVTNGVLLLVAPTAQGGSKQAMEAIINISSIFPTVSLSRVMTKLIQVSHFLNTCEVYDCSVIKTRAQYTCCRSPQAVKAHEYSAWSWDNGSGVEMLFLFASGLVYFIILAFIESSLPAKIASLFVRKEEPSERMGDGIDEDVLAEEKDISQKIALLLSRQSLSTDECLMVHKLRKRFKGKTNVLAVDSVSFKVPRQTCFGLLGVNGAGKTTTFSMLTGDLRPTFGNAFVDSLSVESDRQLFRRKIGYCPQFDALLEVMTGEEMLYMFARLRGIPRNKINEIVTALIKLVNLEEYANKPCGLYSGGNKRKLSIAIAVIGRPQMMFLDEPTAGVDPVSRRQIWELVSDMKQSGIAVILTSHSMEECEALCDKLAIMVKGRLQCIGTVTHLKSKFGQGYTIFMNILLQQDGQDEARIDRLKNIVNENIPGTELKNKNLGLLTFHVTNAAETWGHMFNVMEDMKKHLDELQSYAITATTLEDIFISFAKSANTDTNTSSINVGSVL